MTRRALNWTLAGVITYLLIILSIYVLISLQGDSKFGLVKEIIEKSLNLLISVPAAILAYSFNRRIDFTKNLYTLWEKMNKNFAEMIVFLENENNDRNFDDKKYYEILVNQRAIIEQVRAVYKNMNSFKSNDGGLYPIEPVKTLYSLFRSINKDNFSKLKDDIKDKLITESKSTRDLLKEFERFEPSQVMTPFIISKKGKKP